MENYKLIPFNFKAFNNKYLVINNVGEHFFLDKEELYDLVNKKNQKHSLLNKLYYFNDNELNKIIRKYRNNKFYLNQGTSLFIIILTNRCDQSCIYCQASRKKVLEEKYDMSKSTAKKAVDLIMQSPQRNITIEFQGGEPLLNFKTLEYIVSYSKKYEKKFDKKITFNLVSNLLILKKEHLKFFLDNKISICTSLDGNKEIHDYNRPYSAGSSYNLLKEKIKIIKNEAKRNKKRIIINAIQTTTKRSLKYYKKIIDTYIKLGFKSIYIRPLNRFGLASKSFNVIGYSPYEYLEFYNNALDYIIRLNKKGINFIEGSAQIFLGKIFQKRKINHMDIRSPCGASIGQIAINYDGEIYTCDEGRMMAEDGDKSFKIGNIYSSLYKDLYDNKVTKIMCMASCAESLPSCYQCPYLPYCGVCPIVNYQEEGNIFKNNGYRCLINKGILDTIFRYLKRNDKKTISILKTWIR